MDAEDQAVPISPEDRWELAKKLQALDSTLSPGEKVVIDTLFEVFITEVTGKRIDELLADIPDSPELLDDVAGFMLEDAGNVRFLATITLTIPPFTPTCER